MSSLGLTRNRKIFTALIDELIQSGFITKCSPELQSIRVTESQSSLLGKGDEGVAQEGIEMDELDKEVGLGEEVEKPQSLGQPKLQQSTPRPKEINGGAEGDGQPLLYAAALGSFPPVKSRFDRH